MEEIPGFIKDAILASQQKSEESSSPDESSDGKMQDLKSFPIEVMHELEDEEEDEEDEEEEEENDQKEVEEEDVVEVLKNKHSNKIGENLE